MSSLITDEIRSKAIIYQGKDICKAQQQRLLKEVGLPNGLLPIEEAYECGHVEETGFVWLKQKKKSEHKFEKIGRLVTYGTEVTAYAEPTKIKKLTGVKAREMMIWLTINEITVPSLDAADKVNFKTTTGLYRTFPFDAFVVPDIEIVDLKEKEDVKKENENMNEDVKKEIKSKEEAVKKEIKSKNEDVKNEIKSMNEGVKKEMKTTNGIVNKTEKVAVLAASEVKEV